jgi:hypothetical protein
MVEREGRKGQLRWVGALAWLVVGATWMAACSTSASSNPQTGLVVRGAILDRLGGSGLEGIEIYVRSPDEQDRVVAVTDSVGQYVSGPLPVALGVTVEVHAVGSAASFYPQTVKARMETETAEWQLDFVKAWPVKMWARAAERIHLGQPKSDHPAGVAWAAEAHLGGGTLLDDVPFYYWIGGGDKQYLGATNANGELFADPVWLPIGAEASFGPALAGYRFSPPDCSWRHEPPIESIGILFVGDSTSATPTPGRVRCEQVP